MRRAIITPTADTGLRAHNPRQPGHPVTRDMVATSEALLRLLAATSGAPSFQTALG
jgi:hypothetical protein